MLRHLSVSNYALIDHLELDLHSGLTTVTGETGAGKSIVLGALGLILGNRADIGALRDKSGKCVVEGTFDIAAYQLTAFFEDSDLDYEPTTILRREINASGKSRAFVNDTPVKLSKLRELGERLVDIHSQHETLSLNYAGFPLSMVDAYAGNAQLLIQYHNAYAALKQAQARLNELTQRERNAAAELDYIRFQHNELEQADLSTDNDLEALDAELNTLNNAEEIKSVLFSASHGLSGADDNLLNQLASVRGALDRIAKLNTEAQSLSGRINSAYLELDDVASDLDALANSIDYDQERIELVTARLDTLNGLLQKHRLQTVEELEELHQRLADQLHGIDNLDEAIAAARQEVEEARTEAFNLARQLSKKRTDVRQRIQKDVHAVLQQLGMPNARLEVDVQISEELHQDGIDRVGFLFSANKGSKPRELHKVASGGELSRLMLSIKSLLANLTSMPTIIFDEIDTGVSGEVADKVGNIMRSMAEGHQVVSITHLPQIATKGHQHLLVFKETKGKQTFSAMRQLSEEERIQEVAKMLSGEAVSDAALENARTLLGQG